MAMLSRKEKRRIPTYDDPSEVVLGEVGFDYDKCNGCMLCVKICPASSLVKRNKRPAMTSSPVHDCMACGDCAAICPEQAIHLKRSFRCNRGLYKTLDHGELVPPRL